MRRFERVRDEFIKYGQNPEDIKMPVRATKTSVGYDFYSPIETIIEPGKMELIFSNIKAYYEPDEAMGLATTSGQGKKGLILSQGLGIIESDYVDNPSNDGNIGFMIRNLGDTPHHIKVGDKLGHVFFFKYLTVDNEEEITTKRVGGFGSTGK